MARPPGPDDAEDLRDRLVHQLLVRRLQIGKRIDRRSLTDRELAGLRAVRDIAELGNLDASTSYPLQCWPRSVRADSKSAPAIVLQASIVQRSSVPPLVAI